jgi:hypothetical protein
MCAYIRARKPLNICRIVGIDSYNVDFIDKSYSDTIPTVIRQHINNVGDVKNGCLSD